ncbi:MAG: YdeI/OmpD-associated family protein [Anaerolineae bacterium]|nr:YdeI/OmpD-associated family protein [Anaerolineae bacterium]
MTPVFFETPADLRAWFEQHASSATELWVGYYKVDSGKPSITWPESVDQALCFGWIDGIRKGIDAVSYQIRFTPRKPRSKWSAVNIKRVEELGALGLMQPAGLAAFAARVVDDTPYSYERRDAITFDAEYEQQFRANSAAWDWFTASAPSYQKSARHWVMSAKKAETRLSRLQTLIADSQAGRTVPPLTSPGKKKA